MAILSLVPNVQSLTSPYTVRISKRARRVRLTYSVREGLVVVVPKRFNHKHIPPIVQEKAGWIKRIREKLEKEHIGRDPSLSDKLPSRIAFPAIGLTWEVSYQEVYRKSLLEQGNHLSVTAEEHAGIILHQWLRKKAHEHLIPWLTRVSRETALDFSSIVIRNQKSRWGSCSRHKRISLNQKLLFLPPHLVDYLMVHELCHTKQLNHSAKYWALVGSFLPEYRALDSELRRAWQRYVPVWAES